MLYKTFRLSVGWGSFTCTSVFRRDSVGLWAMLPRLPVLILLGRRGVVAMLAGGSQQWYFRELEAARLILLGRRGVVAMLVGGAQQGYFRQLAVVVVARCV